MINLLPEDNKKELKAARMNVVLFRYNIMTLIAVGILLLALGGFYAYLTTTKASAEAAQVDNEREASRYNKTKKDAEEYRANLTKAKQILANQVNYTSVIFSITKLLPSGVILDNINLTAQDFGNQTTITAKAKDYTAVSKLKENFEKPDGPFSNVYFQTIDSPEGGDKDYPLNVSISVKINKATP